MPSHYDRAECVVEAQCRLRILSVLQQGWKPAAMGQVPMAVPDQLPGREEELPAVNTEAAPAKLVAVQAKPEMPKPKAEQPSKGRKFLQALGVSAKQMNQVQQAVAMQRFAKSKINVCLECFQPIGLDMVRCKRCKVRVENAFKNCSSCQDLPLCEACKGNQADEDAAMEELAAMAGPSVLEVKEEVLAKLPPYEPPPAAQRCDKPVVIRNNKVVHWATPGGVTACRRWTCGTDWGPAKEAEFFSTLPADWRSRACKSCFHF